MQVDLDKLTPSQFEKFRAFIYQQSGINIDINKVSMLSNRIRKRLRAGSFADFDTYYQYLNSRSGNNELSFFLDVVTTHETSFLRTPSQFDWLRQHFISEITKEHRTSGRPTNLKIWSAGCANGAEAYSMAICLLENSFRLRNWKLEIHGTDISQENIKQAEHGVYKERALRLIPTEQRKRWFRRRSDQEWVVRANVRQPVQFACHNLMHPYGESDFDCVFIRNVLIYFDAQSKQNVVRNLLRSLNSGGYLVLGPSEGVHDLLSSMERVSPLIYRKIPDADLSRGRGSMMKGTTPDSSSKHRNRSTPRSSDGDL